MTAASAGGKAPRLIDILGPCPEDLFKHGAASVSRDKHAHDDGGTGLKPYGPEGT